MFIRKTLQSADCYKQAQSIVEYLLLLTAVVAVVLIGFKQLVPKVQTSSEGFYNKAAIGIMGKAPTYKE